MTANASAGAGTGHPPWVPDDLFPFESRFADLPGWRLHCIDEGNGPTPLLLHGNPTWSFLYRDIVKGLSDRYRCIAVDHPGFGLSKAAPGYRYTPGEHALALEQLVQRLDLSDVTMMVQDWGGPIGFAVATRQPERFAGFVIGNTWAWPNAALLTAARRPDRPPAHPEPQPLRRAHPARRRSPRDAARGGHERLSRTVPDPRLALANGDLPPRDPGKQALPRDHRAGAGPAERSSPRTHRVAHQGRGVRRSRTATLGAAVPNHDTVPLEGAGHYIQEDAAEEIVTAIRHWGAAHPPGSPGKSR
jgi:haloalkane dehalogenase